MIFVFFCLIMVAFGIALSIYGITRPVKIKFPYSPLDWTGPILMLYSHFVGIFLCEITFSLLAINIIKDNSFVAFIVARFLENGFLIPIGCFILTKIFRKNIRSYNLDYLRQYSVFVEKICLSTIIIAVSIMLLITSYLNYDLTDTITVTIINHIIMWVVTVIGSWIGFGFGSSGRPEAEKQWREDIYNTYNRKEVINFWGPIVIFLLLGLAIIYFTIYQYDWLDRYKTRAAVLTASFLIPGLISHFFLIRKYDRSEDDSIRDFYKAVKAYKSGKTVHKRFGRMKYHIENDTLCINSVNIQYPEHENDKEFNELFKSVKEEINTENFDDALDYLTERNNRQKQYINDQFEKCKKEMRDKNVKRK